MDNKGNVVYKDDLDREIVRINAQGHMAFARFPDMKQEYKDFMVKLYVETTGKGEREILGFLNYETEENEFCS